MSAPSLSSQAGQALALHIHELQLPEEGLVAGLRAYTGRQARLQAGVRGGLIRAHLGGCLLTGELQREQL